MGLPASVSAFSLYLNARSYTGASVKVKDIARVEGEERPGEISEKIILDNITSPVYLSRDQIQRNLGNVDHIFGAGVWVVPLSRPLDADAVKSLLMEQIRRLPDGSAFLESAVLSLDPLEIKAGPGSRLEFRLPNRAGSISPGRRIFALDLVATDDRGHSVNLMRQQVPVHIFKKISVPVATRDLETGETMREGDWTMEIREVDHLETRYATGSLTGRRVLSSMRKGNELTASSVQFIPAVRRGQSMDVVYQTQSVVVRCRSVAGRDGSIGEVVPVRLIFPSGTRSDAKARITDEGTGVLERQEE